ncbi:hypothetical protein PISL3812_03090 [Talaromyces islandicus]|uniref:Uncharacterized protein n=1 Tax=Talaromyces islandicus TaxID=28573 RepID=A0A0U1LRQ6_TALIS|nr:hypothetical protein PISL3812_03090 [Talaromyces islandicus]
MKGKPILNLRPWPKIHQPLPRSPRESQQLLSALTTSFRRQLDAADTNQSAQSANEHMQTILNNPLFRVVPPGLRATAAESRASLDQRIAKEPMAVFDELVAAGSINRENLGNCLFSQLALIGSQSSDVKQEMQKTGAGSRIVNWFWASDSASRKLLFRSQRTSRAAVKFMAAEGRHKEIAVFLKMLKELNLGGKNGHIPDPRRRIFKLFLQDYMEADVRYGRGISGSLTTLIHAAELTASMPDEVRTHMLRDSALYLVGLIVSHGRSSLLSSVSTADFDRFCNVLDTIPELALRSEALQLYHPSHPTAQPFLKYIRDHPELEAFSSSPPEQAQEPVLQVHLDALHFLLDQERYKDALRLVPRIEKMFSEDRGEVHKAPDSRSQMDALMERLDVALV